MRDATHLLGDPRLPERFWNFVTAIDTGYVSMCWLFKMHRDPLGSGYHLFTVGKWATGAHRFSYTALVGPIPDGLTIDHLCRRPGCVRPDHLEAVTQAENNARSWGPSAINSRRDTCVNGHSYDGENTFTRRDGRRDCRQCMRDRANEYAAELRIERIDNGTYHPHGWNGSTPETLGERPCGHSRDPENSFTGEPGGECRECSRVASWIRWRRREGLPIPPEGPPARRRTATRRSRRQGTISR